MDRLANQRRAFNLLQSATDEPWFKLPLQVLRDVGPAAQTLAAIRMINKKETFVETKAIARQALLPVKTARNHLTKLEEKCWIANHGRGKTRRGFARRTNTISLTPIAQKAFSEADYSALPWWAPHKLSWCACVVFSLVMSELMRLNWVVENQMEGHASLPFIIEELGADRFKFSYERIMRDTGLSKQSVFNGKAELVEKLLVEEGPSVDEKGGWIATQLIPNPWCYIRIFDAKEAGKIYTVIHAGEPERMRKDLDAAMEDYWKHFNNPTLP